MSDHYQVAIVGCGPVGATMACLLGQAGIKTVILDRNEGIYNLPRAVQFDDEVMRVFQAIGIADEMEPKTLRHPGMRFEDDSGNLLLDWPRPQEVSPNGWRANYRFHQPDLERVLRERVAQHDFVDMVLGTEVTAIEESGGNSTVAMKHRETGEERIIEAEWVIGCDGANSFVRQHMGAALNDLGFREKWLVVDVMLKRPRPDLSDFSIQFCSSERPMTYVPGPQNRRRWEISLQPGDDMETVTDDPSVWALLDRWLTKDDAELVRRAIYEFRSCISESWRQDRLLLAGDAAHQMPPFMGQGMCTGIRDVSNLAWKLISVIKDEADAVLLDTYETERVPHVQAYVDMAVRLGGLINTSNTKAGLAAAFPQADGSAKMKSIQPSLGDGLSIANDETARKMFPQWMTEEGGKSDDDTNGMFVLHVLEPEVAQGTSNEILVRPAAPGSPAESALRDRNAVAALVRPDHYILGTARSVDEIAVLMNLRDRYYID